MNGTDSVKKAKRREIKEMRRNMDRDYKRKLDCDISENVIKSGLLENAETVLIYSSTDIEVGTEGIISYCLRNGIKTALPRCFPGSIMKFYYYDDSITLERSAYGICEPPENPEREVREFDKTVCIVPALSYDKDGYRLGYGGGFYDRFLSKHNGILTIGICYSENICDRLARNEFDQKVTYVVTEKNPEENNG